MDVVFEGRLTDEVQLKNVLLKILEKRPSGNLLLRVATPQKDCDGKLCIVDGRFITAAVVANTRETGYDAVRKILSVREGNFACLRPSREDSLTIPFSLNIELEKVVPLVPNLPESPNGLHDEKSLLDKVFGSSAFESEPPLQPTQPTVQIIEEAPARAKNPNASWQLLQPLVAPNEVVEIAPPAVQVQTAPPPPVIAPVNPDELAALSSRTQHVDRTDDVKVKQGKRVSVLSPMVIVSVVGLIFVMELLAIFFWKPLNAYIAQKTGAPIASSAAHKTAAKKPASGRH